MGFRNSEHNFGMIASKITVAMWYTHLKPDKIWNSRFSKAKIFKSPKILNSGFWKDEILKSTKILN